MSDKQPRSFNKLEKATERFQEEKYMDSLMGSAVGRDDERSRKRRAEAKEYDNHLGNIDENRKERDEETFNTEVPSSERDPLLRRIESVSEQIDAINKIIASINNRTGEDGAANKELRIATTDLAAKEVLRKNLIAKYRNVNGPMHGPKTFEQAVIDGEVMHGPKTKEEAVRDAILDPANFAELQAELDEDSPASSDAPYNWAEDPEWNVSDENTPPTSDDEVTLIAPVVRGVSGDSVPTVVGDMPQDPAERPGWVRRHRNQILGAAAAFAIGLGTGFLMWGDKDNQRSGSDEKTEQPAKPGTHKPQSDVMKNLEFKQNFSSRNHSGDRVNAWGTERTQLVENAPNGILHGEALNEYIGNHDKITAKNVEKLVNVRFQEIYGLDAAKFNSAWGQQKREEMKREYLSDSGHSLSEAGRRAHAIHLSEMRSGKIVKMTAAEAASKYDLDLNSYMTEGKLKGGIDDKAYAAGKTHSEIYVMFDKDGNIEHAEIGNCGNEVFYIKGVITTVPTTTTSTNTFNGGIKFTPHPHGTPNPGPGPGPGPKPNDHKRANPGSSDSTHQYGNNSGSHDNDARETHKDSSSGNSTNGDTNTSPNANKNGSGSSDTASGNTTPTAPDRNPGDAAQAPNAGDTTPISGDTGKP